MTTQDPYAVRQQAIAYLQKRGLPLSQGNLGRVMNMFAHADTQLGDPKAATSGKPTASAKPAKKPMKKAGAKSAKPAAASTTAKPPARGAADKAPSTPASAGKGASGAPSSASPSFGAGDMGGADGGAGPSVASTSGGGSTGPRGSDNTDWLGIGAGAAGTGALAYGLYRMLKNADAKGRGKGGVPIDGEVMQPDWRDMQHAMLQADARSQPQTIDGETTPSGLLDAPDDGSRRVSSPGDWTTRAGAGSMGAAEFYGPEAVRPSGAALPYAPSTMVDSLPRGMSSYEPDVDAMGQSPGYIDDGIRGGSPDPFAGSSQDALARVMDQWRASRGGGGSIAGGGMASEGVPPEALDRVMSGGGGSGPEQMIAALVARMRGQKEFRGNSDLGALGRLSDGGLGPGTPRPGDVPLAPRMQAPTEDVNMLLRGAMRRMVP